MSEPEGGKNAASFAEEMPSLEIFFKSLSKRVMHSRCLIAHTGRVKPTIGKSFTGVFCFFSAKVLAIIQSTE